ncbi:MAG: GSU2403 family nucleotidyltransferase fold protein [Planctomycetota bacterium]|nr:GSU2403 family nucleotidyltransferase fold protein [Planctomycetota bacterium]
MSGDLPKELTGVFVELARCIVGFGPYQEDAVLCGGLVPVIYRRVLPSPQSRLRPLTTFDLDWTLPQQLTSRGESLHSRLLASGFVARLSGSAKMPVTHYVPDPGQGTGESPIYIEFLTPRTGSKYSRKQTNQGIVEVQPGLHAQTDPYLSLLLAEIVNVSVSKIPELGLSGEHMLKLPHPICFILQKALIREKRGPSKQDNDACHIVDVVMLTHDMWPEMREVLSRLLNSGAFSTKWFSQVHTTLDGLFASPTSNGSIAVAQNYSGSVSEEEISSVVSAFLAACW